MASAAIGSRCCNIIRTYAYTVSDYSHKPVSAQYRGRSEARDFPWLSFSQLFSDLFLYPHPHPVRALVGPGVTGYGGRYPKRFPDGRSGHIFLIDSPRGIWYTENNHKKRLERPSMGTQLSFKEYRDKVKACFLLRPSPVLGNTAA